MQNRGLKAGAVTIAAAAAIVLSFRPGLLAQTEEPSSEGLDKSAKAAAPAQPIPYSHKKHLALGLKCDSCHTNPTPGIHMTIPQSGKCMACHTEVAKESPAIRKLAEYDESKKPVPWVRVYAVPAWVYWNHRTHLQAKVECDACHGQVAEMDTMKLATDVTTMQGCVDCHQQREAPAGCETCHENPGTQ
jgi:hypothetical protein